MPKAKPVQLFTAAKLLETQVVGKRQKRLLLPEELSFPPKVTHISATSDVVGWLYGTWDGSIKVKVSISLDRYTLIGRHLSCDVPLPFRQISNHHLRLYAVRTDNPYAFVALQDLSSNGFILNDVVYRRGKKVEVEGRDLGSGRRSVVLIHGDRIKLPGWEGEFVYHQSPDFYHLSQSIIPFDRSSSSLSNISKFSINTFVVLDRPLGYGGFGVVHLGRHVPTSTLVAIKTISTAHESTDVTEGRNREIDVLNRIPSHPCINQLLSVLQEGDTVHLVLELVTGGDLFGYVCKHVQDGGLIESEVKWLAYQMIQGVSWLHKHGVVHRDLKLENILIHTSTVYPRILIADFGLATFIDDERSAAKRSISFGGTADNLAPELLGKWLFDHGYNVNPDRLPARMDWELGDAWSLGIALYLCYSPYHPFDNSDEDAQGDHELDQRSQMSISTAQSKSMAEARKFLTERRDTIERILIGRFFWDPQEHWDLMSSEGKNFIRMLLEPNVALRMSVKNAIKHPWISSSKTELEDLWRRVVLEGGGVDSRGLRL